MAEAGRRGTNEDDELLDSAFDLEASAAEGSTSLESQLRKLPMTVVKYNQWTVIDANREQGEQVRAEEAALQRPIRGLRVETAKRAYVNLHSCIE